MSPPHTHTGETQMYRVYIRSATRLQECLVEGVQERAATCTGLCVNSVHLHVKDTVVIVEEGTTP